jgi:response regulator NasT
MRVWLIDDKSSTDTSRLEPLLCQLAERQGGVRLVGVTPFQPEFPESIRKLAPDLLDLLIFNERNWPDGDWTRQTLDQGVGLVVVTAPERAERFVALAEQYPILFLPPAPTPDQLWLALVGAFAARQRERRCKQQVDQMQERLNDRIVIERAKGVLVQRLKISEEEAYKRLRMLSRRQRRQIRDIAQSLLDTQFLFSVEVNGFSRGARDPVASEKSRSKGAAPREA